MKKLDIKRALADHNMTQVQLGEKLNVFPQSLTSVIKGNPTVKKLEDIAVAIGCDITDLFYSETEDTAEELPAMIIKLNQYKRLSWRTLSFKQKLSAHIVVKSEGWSRIDGRIIILPSFNFPFNRGKKKIAKPINNIPRKAIRTETTIRIVSANKVFLENTSFLKSPHVVNSSFSFALLRQSQKVTINHVIIANTIPVTKLLVKTVSIGNFS